MPSLTRRFIKTAFGLLLIGLLLGLWLLVRREMYGEWANPYLISAHTHLVFVGFVMFMILGVALWLFPKPARDDYRYKPILIEWVYWMLLSGTLLRFGAELLQGLYVRPSTAGLVITGGVLQFISLVLYGYSMWSRIRSTTDYKQQRISRSAAGRERPD